MFTTFRIYNIQKLKHACLAHENQLSFINDESNISTSHVNTQKGEFQPKYKPHMLHIHFTRGIPC